jgi:predicted ATPase
MEFKPPVLKSLRLVNYRSIKDETIYFHNPMFMVGRNGSGKSNIVDALAFLSEAMTLGLDFAVNSRSSGNSLFFMDSMQDESMDFYIDSDLWSYYVSLKYSKDNGVYISKEECESSKALGANFERGELTFGTNILSGASDAFARFNTKNFVLPLMNGNEDLGKVYDCISAFKVYAISSNNIRKNEMGGGSSGAGYLEQDGGNLGAIYSHIESYSDGVNGWLPYIVPGMKVLSIDTVDGRKSLMFEERIAAEFAKNLFITQVSDGTLSAIGNLTALLQKKRPSVIVLEEPENNLHYGALFILLEAIQEAALSTQIIVTTHSPDLIDEKWMMPENIRIVEKINGETKVRMPSEEASIAIREHLMYPGQLLRANVLDPKVDSMVE